MLERAGRGGRRLLRHPRKKPRQPGLTSNTPTLIQNTQHTYPLLYPLRLPTQRPNTCRGRSNETKPSDRPQHANRPPTTNREQHANHLSSQQTTRSKLRQDRPRLQLSLQRYRHRERKYQSTTQPLRTQDLSQQDLLTNQEPRLNRSPTKHRRPKKIQDRPQPLQPLPRL